MTDKALDIFSRITIADLIIYTTAIALLYKYIKSIVQKINTAHDERQEEHDRIHKVDVLVIQIELLKAGLLSLLRFRLYAECEKHIKIGMISVQDMNDVRHLYESYKALGGNGTGDKLYKEVQKLPIRQ